MSIIDKNYVHYKQAAECLKLSSESVRRYIHAGKISAEATDSTYYIHIEEIKRFTREKRPRGRQPKKS